MRRLAIAAAMFFLVCCTPAAATHIMSASHNFKGPRFLIVPLTAGRTTAVSSTALFHTLFNDFAMESDGTTYVQTGDIPAMWLRDSSAQTIPYIRFQRYFPVLRARFAGVIKRNARNILIDPYANAFTSSYGIWERKWEVDSPASFAGLTWVYWSQTGDRKIFTPQLHDALRTIVNTYDCEQHHAQCSHYAFPGRVNTQYNYAGNTGLIWSAFRPSDDAVTYRYNIPQQMFASVALRQIAALVRDGYRDGELARRAYAVQTMLERGIERYGLYYNFKTGWQYVYETDAQGHNLLADDANIPDLLAIPIYEYRDARDPRYLATRAFVLSVRNPYYYFGRYAQGLGSPHTPPGWVWPLGIVTRGLTATSPQETVAAITMLAETDSREYMIHESFDPNAYWRYTRAEFGWANAFYAELLFRSVAGFETMPYNPDISANFAQTQTPALVGPYEQALNQARLIGALGELLSTLR